MLGAGWFLISVHFSAQVIKFLFSANIIIVQNDSRTKCFQNVTCPRSYHLTLSFVNQNKKMLTCLCFQVLSVVQTLDPNFKTDLMLTFVSYASFCLQTKMKTFS